MNVRQFTDHLLGVDHLTSPMDRREQGERTKMQIVMQGVYNDLVEALQRTRNHPGLPLYKVRQALLEVFDEAELDALANHVNE